MGGRMRYQTNHDHLIQLSHNVTSDWLQQQLDQCIRRIEKNMLRFQDNFPSACATNGMYRIKGNDDWTNGFWTGMLWLAYEITNNPKFSEQAMRNVDSFKQRLDDHYILDHHDIGFLYSLSAGAGYALTQRTLCKDILIQAADVLINRFQEKGQFIQAWGAYGDPKEYRLIIDSLINLPLLFKATELSGNKKYSDVASQHYHTVLKTVIRDDSTTFHTYYFDTKTGEPTHGATHQGHSDRSIWARGQSWAILGIPLNEQYLHSVPFPSIYPSIVRVFLDNLPENLIPYWDFDFTDKHPSAKDSSALAITAAGLLAADSLQAYPEANDIARGMVYQLGENCTPRDDTNEGLLLHGVYAFAEGKGIDEPNLWGDYFYLEDLVHLARKDAISFW